MRADGLDLVLFAIGVSLVAPTVLMLAETGVGLVSRTARRWLHAGLLGLLFSLVLWQVVRDLEGPDWLELTVYLTSAGAITWACLRSEFARTMVAILAVATPVTMIGFLFTGPGNPVFFGDSPREYIARVEQKPPVVMLVLDEFPLAALESSPGKIDGDHFPNFARLARQSDWFENARAPGDVTVLAVPSILSGKHEGSVETPPEVGKYPENLFSLLSQAGYRVQAHETVTDLCPHDVCPRQSRTRARLAKIALNGLRYNSPLPVGITNNLIKEVQPRTLELEPSPSEEIERFVNDAGREPGTLNYQHVMLPHIPWNRLPDGSSYPAPLFRGLGALENSDTIWTGPPELTNAEFQRFLLQVGYVDTQLGRLVESMKADGSWKEALFVVVADHGVSFKTRMVRRFLTEENAGWILPVPLFVKYPGQSRGKRVRNDVHTNQLLPTMLKALDLPVPDGLPPAIGTAEPPDPMRVPSSTGKEIKISSSRVRDLFGAAVRHRNRTFPDNSFYSLTGDSDMLGTRASGRDDLEPVTVEFSPLFGNTVVQSSSGSVPAFVLGTLPGTAPCPELAIAVNGRIGLTVRSYRQDQGCEFSGVVDHTLFREGENAFQAYRISEDYR